MSSRPRRSLRPVLRALSVACQRMSTDLLATPDSPPRRAWWTLARDELVRMNLQEPSQQQIAETLAQALVQARWAWKLTAAEVRSVQGEPGFYPSSGSLLGKVLRLATASALPDVTSPEAGLVREDSWNDLNGLLEECYAQLELNRRGAGGCGAGIRQSPPRAGMEMSPSQEEWEGSGADLLDFDMFLGAHDPHGKARHGVYFTPRVLATYIVREVDRLLREELGLPLGLADTTTWNAVRTGAAGLNGLHRGAEANEPVVRILDPAAGTGVFLLAVVDHIHATWKMAAQPACASDAEASAAWNAFVEHHLLPRLTAQDVLLPACAVAWIRLAEQLARTGYRFAASVPLDVRWGNSLFEPTAEEGGGQAGGGGPNRPPRR